MDISHTITAKSDQLNAADLLGGPITIQIENVAVLKGGDQPISISIGGEFQPFKPCLTVRRILARLWGRNSDDWKGKWMTLYCDEGVIWAGEKVGGIRISHVSGIDGRQEIPARQSKHKVMKYIIDPLKIDSPVLTAYSDEDITKNCSSWVELFRSGKSSPAHLITGIKQKFTLTEAQENQIYEFGEDAKQEEES